jgi:protein-disulfide isomerase
VPDERLTKNERREQAREQARLAREKQKRAEQRRRWLIPSGVTVVILAIVAVVALVVSNSAPAPQTAAGPKNMISDGILLTGSGGTMVATPTAAIKAKGTPTPTKYSTSDGVAHIVTYVDFSCPSCQAFEAASADTIKSLVEEGKATLEIHPIAILDTHYLASKYSTRANNVGACVANYAPDSFYAVMQQLYVDQPTENTNGLTNAQLVTEVHKAGLNNGDVDRCVTGVKFEPWLTAATSRATNSPLPNSTAGAPVTGTPTILVNGQTFTGDFTSASAFTTFISQVLAG